MPDGVVGTSADADATSREYEPDIEPLVAAAAPQVGLNHAFLGSLGDLLPSGGASAQALTAEDQAWLQALERVAHGYDLGYELITDAGEGPDTLWLVPLH